jgi:hypothetical protein
MSAPYRDCPQYDRCSCNDCPLDPRSATHGGDRVALEGEDPCSAQRKTREKVAMQHGYPAEWARLKRELKADGKRAAWMALPEEERARRMARLTPFRSQDTRDSDVHPAGAVGTHTEAAPAAPAFGEGP